MGSYEVVPSALVRYLHVKHRQPRRDTGEVSLACILTQTRMKKIKEKKKKKKPEETKSSKVLHRTNIPLHT